MALISCSACLSDNDIHLDGITADGARTFRCGDCGHTWTPESKTALPKSTRTPFEMARGRFANPSMVSADHLKVVKRLKARYLKAHPVSDDTTFESWARFQPMLTRDGLAAATPQELRELATTGTGVRGGSMSVFNRVWKQLGEEEAADRTRASIGYLLHGPDATPLEDRLTRLVDGHGAEGSPTMGGLREPFFTKVLHVAQPHRFLPILTYGDEETGKKDLALAVYGLHLPKAEPTAMHVGRLAVWSNDLLLELSGDGFDGAQHVASFLWWAKDRVGESALTPVR